MRIIIPSDYFNNAATPSAEELSNTLVKKNFARAVYVMGQGENASLALEATSPAGVDYLNERRVPFEVINSPA